MTNGEKIQQDFACEVCEPIIEDDIIHVIFADKKDSAIGFDWSWWSAEYKEPTTKNCESCGYYGSHHEVCNYCYKCSLWTEEETTTKNDLGVSSELEKNSKKLEKNFGELDCISREQARLCLTGINLPNDIYKLIALFDKRLQKLPSISPKSDKSVMKPRFCEECGITESYPLYGQNFCRYCGARLKSEDKE